MAGPRQATAAKAGGLHSEITAECILDRISIADVSLDMGVERYIALEALPGPTRAGGRPEKRGAHVVVDTDDDQALPAEEPRRLGSDQSSSAGDDGNAHS